MNQGAGEGVHPPPPPARNSGLSRELHLGARREGTFPIICFPISPVNGHQPPPPHPCPRLEAEVGGGGGRLEGALERAGREP